MTTIYFENYKQMGVEVIYDDESGKRIYDNFSSMYLFNLWVKYEMQGSEVIEITDSNYTDLIKQGVL